MATIKRFEEFKVWQKSRQLNKQIYTLTSTGKLSKEFDLKNQILRAAGSIMDNIAEGWKEAVMANSFNFSALPRDRQEKFAHSYIER